MYRAVARRQSASIIRRGCVLSASPHISKLIFTDGRALLVHFRKGTVIYHMSFNAPVHACSFSPNGKYFAVSHNNGVQVWETPSLLVRDFAPFVLHGTYTGHQDEVVGITWSKTGRYADATSDC